MTKTISMVSHKNYNLNTNEGFVLFFTSKVITCFIDGFISIMKTQPSSYLLYGSEHIHWILDLEGEVHSIGELWISGLQECKSNGIFKVRQGGTGKSFRLGLENLDFFQGGVAPACIYLPRKARRGRFNIRRTSMRIHREPKC
jgi:hypothetical protein